MLIRQNQTRYFPAEPIPSYASAPMAPQLSVPSGSSLLNGLLQIGLVFVISYGAYRLLSEPERRKPRCSVCGRTSHTARNCPIDGPRRSLAMTKVGVCQCCGGRFRRTELHHYAGRADGTKGKEMCGTCHLHCGHNGHYGNAPINPRYCRVAD